MTLVSIYGLCDPRNEQLRYVGATNNMNRRYGEHLRNNNGTHLGNWIKNILTDNLKPDIFEIEKVSEANWEEAERFWITQFKCLGANLVNQTSGGEGNKGLSLESRQKISLSKKGKPVSEGTKLGFQKYRLLHGKEMAEKISITLKGNSNAIGHTMTDRGRDKMRYVATHRSPEIREKLRLAALGKKYHLGFKHSDEAKKKIGIQFKGKKLTEEHKRKISAAMVGKKNTLGIRHSVVARANKSTVSKRIWAERRKKG